jgi:hypothetical protein
MIVAIAIQIDVHGGGRLWLPPTGRPYWINGDATEEATDADLARLGLAYLVSPIPAGHTDLCKTE